MTKPLKLGKEMKEIPVNPKQFFEELNAKMQEVYRDPYKWLLDIDIEDIPQHINEMQTDIENLLQSMQDYDGDINLHDKYVDDTIRTIEYKNECIDILKNILEDEENEQ